MRTDPDSAPLEGRIRASNHRPIQMSRTAGRKLFDAEHKEVFLDWFSATCNVALSAEQAGVARQTVFKHRRSDSAFAEAWDRALEQGYAALEASLVREAIAGEDRDDGRADLPAPEDVMTLTQRMALLREYRRSDGMRGARRAGKAPLAQHVASDAEMEKALVKRLIAFADRVRAADAEGGNAVPALPAPPAVDQPED